MNRQEVRATIEQVGIIPAVRVTSAEDAIFASRAVFGGGIPIVELTMTIPDVLKVIAELSASQPGALVGAGTILDADQAMRCMEAGAAFLTSPGLDLDMMRFAEQRGIAVIPGALTPSEVMQARKTGADFVKIFPCAQVGGPAYIRALKAPFPHVPLIASGGVNQQTAADFIRAGATGLGIGVDLIPREAVRTRNADWIRELSRRFLAIVRETRAQIARRKQAAAEKKDLHS
ncbi:MAG: bifunctional 4-hydroxy-2-oxoglutarate aldolase/2-dehydro-3-deoxy-phosphogluconate aldolase [Acidobacteriota bacterium]|nr:bifunctional 4-hydroxy-2-oxoglutarate aldolase/2-dehydro-3-deoxy-phosphogluconate aldolase [Acidobacteriota bacterium]